MARHQAASNGSVRTGDGSAFASAAWMSASTDSDANNAAVTSGPADGSSAGR